MERVGAKPIVQSALRHAILRALAHPLCLMCLIWQSYFLGWVWLMSTPERIEWGCAAMILAGAGLAIDLFVAAWHNVRRDSLVVLGLCASAPCDRTLFIARCLGSNLALLAAVAAYRHTIGAKSMLLAAIVITAVQLGQAVVTSWLRLHRAAARMDTMEDVHESVPDWARRDGASACAYMLGLRAPEIDYERAWPVMLEWSRSAQAAYADRWTRWNGRTPDPGWLTGRPYRAFADALRDGPLETSGLLEEGTLAAEMRTLDVAVLAWRAENAGSDVQDQAVATQVHRAVTDVLRRRLCPRASSSGTTTPRHTD